MQHPPIKTVFGVDFSGGAHAGDNLWIARAKITRSRLVLESLDRLANLCGSGDRAIALPHLVGLIQASKNCLWGIDFPFGLPIELAAMGRSWRDQLSFLQKFNGDARAFGHWCIGEAMKVGAKLHIRRCTDRETKTPFDCYHYRIIYQTFHGMRDVLASLDSNIAVLPFQYGTLSKAKSIVVEACPSSTLKRLGLPHQNYKQPAGGALTSKRRRVRKSILDAIGMKIELSDSDRRTIMRNPGGDALDAVIAAVGTWQAFCQADHEAIAKHGRYSLEGRVYA